MSDDSSASALAPDGPAPYGAPPPTEVPPTVDEPKQLSALSRLLNTVVAPGDLFADIRRSARDWWVPMLLLIVVAVGAGFVIQKRLGFTEEQLAKAAVDVQLEKMQKTRADLTPEQQQAFTQQESFMATMFKVAPLLSVVGFPLVIFMLAGIYRIALLIFQAETTFTRVLSVTAYSYGVTSSIYYLLQAVVAFVRDTSDYDVSAMVKGQKLLVSSPAQFVSPTENPVMFAALSYLDIFSIWWLVLVTIGLAAVSKKLGTGTAAVVVFGLYFLMCGLSAVGAMFSPG